VELAGEQKLIA